MNVFGNLRMMLASHRHAKVYYMETLFGNGPFYINATIDYVKHLVTQTKNQVNLKERNISVDRLYTSIEAANWLLEQNIASVGTLQKG